MAGQPALANWAGQMIPNRNQLALDSVERLAESGDHYRLREAARATGNWSLLGVLAALADQARERKKPPAGRRGR